MYRSLGFLVTRAREITKINNRQTTCTDTLLEKIGYMGD